MLIQFFLFVLGLFPLKSGASSLPIKEVSLFQINSAITPATLDYLKLHTGKLPDGALILIKMNTPGGLITTTKDIITLLSNQSHPIVVWITPEGASAASAGAIIASSAHLIYMSPGTNMGAATPVGLGEDIKESDGKNKAINDLTAMVRALSDSRGRPGQPFEEMIKTAASYTDKEALKLNIINGLASSQSEILESINGKSVMIKGAPVTLDFQNHMEIKVYGPTMGQKILEVLANPSTAYFLFLIGVALIYFEMQAPGGYIAGTVGVCFLILAAVAFQVLPLHWGAMGLIAAGIVLLIMEIFIVSYGILSVLGIAAFTIGSLFLFHGEAGFISIKYPVLLSTLGGVGFSVAVILFYFFLEKKKQPQHNNFFIPTGSKGTILLSTTPYQHQVKVKGEIWNATSTEELNIGDKVEVLSTSDKNLIINVKKVNTL